MAKPKKTYSYQRKNRRRCHKSHWRDEHHLLFPGADWRQSVYGRKIRSHKYFKRFIPERTLHRKIHRELMSVPVPPERACREAYYEFLRRYDAHLIDVYHDTMEKRLQLLIDLWADYPKTVAALKKQQEIAMRFYNNGQL